MSKTLPKDGTYTGKKNGQMSVYEAGSGALCVAIPVMLLNADVAWSGKHTETIATSDGALRERSIENLKAIFGFDGSVGLRDWIAGLPELDPNNEVTFELSDCHTEDYEDPKTKEVRPTFKIGWMNPIGGSSRMPASMDRDTFLSKWGEKFKAIDAGATKKPAASASKAPASGPSRAAASGPPSRTNKTTATPRSSSLDEVWGGLQKKYPKDNQDQLSKKFYDDGVDIVAPGTNGEGLTPQQWGEVADKLGV